MATIWQGWGVDLQPIEIVCRSWASIGDDFVTRFVEMGRYLLADTPGSDLAQHASLTAGLGLQMGI